jgi:receptor protein-tyrosine kinase
VASENTHLIERAAERLRLKAGLRAPSYSASQQEAPLDRPPPPPVAPPSPPTAEALRAPSQAIVTNAALQRAGLVVSGLRGRAVEEYRVTAGNLVRNWSERSAPGANLLMITSARANEGKSFSALNLAASIALNGLAEVLLIDADPKQNALTGLLGLSDQPGLFDLAEGFIVDAKTLTVGTEIAGLSIMPVGSNRILLAGKGITRPLATAIEALGRTYASSIVIVDASPCLTTSDPSVLAPLVGQIVMVVEAQRTPRSAVEAALNLVKTCPSITFLLNKAKHATTHAFGDYDYYGS